MMRQHHRCALWTALTLIQTACPTCEPPDTGDAAADATSADQGATDAGRRDSLSADRSGGDHVPRDRPVGGDGTGVDAGYTLDELVGAILVRETFGSTWGYVNASIFDGPSVAITPEHWFERVAVNGPCELRQASFSGDFGNCDPVCVSPQFCTPALTCEDESQLAPAGALTFTGLSRSATMTPTVYGYSSVDFLDGNVFAPGAAIEVSASGGVTPAFSLSAQGVEDMVPIGTGPLVVHDNQDLVLQWVPGTAGDLVEVIVTPSVHIFTWMIIQCRAADTGQLTISRDLLQHLPYDSACTHGECGSRSRIVRYSEDHTALPNGVVRLRGESMANIATQRVP
jgi:hypothetical protein